MTPTKYSEPGDGAYIGLDQKVHYSSSTHTHPTTAADSAAAAHVPSHDEYQYHADAYYSDLSLWDTFRTTLPWQLLTRRDVSVGILRSLEHMTNAQGGVFPRWPLGSVETGCMIGSHGSSFVYDAMLRGLGVEDAFNLTVITEALLQQTTFIPAEDTDADSIAYLLARSDVEHYLQEGYVSLEASPLYERDGKPASLTLSYAYDDYILGQLCEIESASRSTKDLKDTDTDTALLLDQCTSAKQRGGNYKHLWSAVDSLMCPRSSETGALTCPVDPAGLDSWGMWTEGDALQWSYFGECFFKNFP